MAAFAIDALLLLFIVVAIGAAVDEMGGSGAFTAAGALTAFVAYHSASLMNPAVGLGRTAMAITVISLRSGPGLSTFQCVARPVMRLVWLGGGVILARTLREPALMTVPMLIDVALLTFHPGRQTVADLTCGTAVVNLPPVQPHRAPAGPMFSVNDAEFGGGRKW